MVAFYVIFCRDLWFANTYPKIINFVYCFFGLYGCSQERQPGVFIKNVKDGDILSSPINLEFDVEGFELGPSGSIGERISHHHLLVNRDSIMNELVIPSDVNHIHYSNGERKETIQLEPGSYLLTL